MIMFAIPFFVAFYFAIISRLKKGGRTNRKLLFRLPCSLDPPVAIFFFTFTFIFFLYLPCILHMRVLQKVNRKKMELKVYFGAKLNL